MAIDAVSLEAIQNLNQPAYEQQIVEKAGGSEKGGMRLGALREAAIGAGARGGLEWRNRIIGTALDKASRDLDLIYNFLPLMISGRVIPPVLTETRELYTQDGNVDLRLAGHSYKIEMQARFSSRPPQWREYLFVDYGTANPVISNLLPRTSEEQELWKKCVAEGWGKGIKQADDIFKINMNRLNRDFTGMTRYRVLALKNMVSMPIVAAQNMPLTGSGDTMNVDETLLRITALPQFQRDMRDWTPLGSEDDVMTRAPSLPPASKEVK